MIQSQPSGLPTDKYKCRCHSFAFMDSINEQPTTIVKSEEVKVHVFALFGSEISTFDSPNASGSGPR